LDTFYFKKDKNLFCGIDYSLSSPAISLIKIDNVTKEESIEIHCVYKNKKHSCLEYLVEDDNLTIYFHWLKSSFDSSYEKIKILSDLFIPFIKKSDFIGMEDYSFNSVGKVFGIAENSGYLKMLLFNSNKSFELFSPKTIKKFATGNGNARKEDMILEFEKQTKKDIYSLLSIKDRTSLNSPITDIVDSFFVAKLLISEINKQNSFTPS